MSAPEQLHELIERFVGSCNGEYVECLFGAACRGESLFGQAFADYQWRGSEVVFAERLLVNNRRSAATIARSEYTVRRISSPDDEEQQPWHESTAESWRGGGEITPEVRFRRHGGQSGRAQLAVEVVFGDKAPRGFQDIVSKRWRVCEDILKLRNCCLPKADLSDFVGTVTDEQAFILCNEGSIVRVVPHPPDNEVIRELLVEKHDESIGSDVTVVLNRPKQLEGILQTLGMCWGRDFIQHLWSATAYNAALDVTRSHTLFQQAEPVEIVRLQEVWGDDGMPIFDSQTLLALNTSWGNLYMTLQGGTEDLRRGEIEAHLCWDTSTLRCSKSQWQKFLVACGVA